MGYRIAVFGVFIHGCFQFRDIYILSWDKGGYPYLRYWCKSSRDTCTVALEPASYLFDGFTDSKRMGTYWHLEPGETRSVWTHCDIFTGKCLINNRTCKWK